MSVRNTQFVSVLVLSIIALSHAVDWETEDPDQLVTHLEEKGDFKKIIIDDKRNMWAILFYDETDENHAALANDYLAAARLSEDIVKFAVVKVGEHEYLAKQLGLMGSPSIRVYGATRTYNPYTHEWTKDIAAQTGNENMGTLTAKKIASLVTQKMDMNLTVVEPASWAEHWEAAAAAEGGLPRAYLVSKKKSPPPLYAAMSLLHKGRLDMHFVHADKEEVGSIKEAFGMEELSLPTIVVVKDGEVKTLDTKIEAASVVPFLEEHAGPAVELPDELPPSMQKKEEKKEKPKLTLPTVADFEEEVIEAEEAVLVVFHGGQDKCGEQLETAVALLQELGPVARYVQVDVSADEASAKLAAQHDAAEVAEGKECLVLSLLPFGMEKEQGEAYSGEMNAKELAEFLYGSFPEWVEPLDPSGFQAWNSMQDRATPRVLFFSKKDDPPPMLNALAGNFLRLSFGFISTQHEELVQQFQVQKVPTVLTLVIADDDPTGQKMNMMPFPERGPTGQKNKLNYANLHQYCKEIDMIYHPDAADKEREAFRKEAQAEGASPSVHEVSDNAAFEAACSGLCLINFVDAGAENLPEQLAMMKEAKANTAFSVFWVDATRQLDFATQFDVYPETIPDAAVYSSAKLRYAKMKGAYSAAALGELIAGIMQGRIGTAMMQDPPRLVDGGVDPPPPEAIEEEEFDLSDIMGEEVASGGDRQAVLDQAEVEMAEAASAAKDKAASGKSSKKKKKGKKKGKKSEL